MNASIKKIGNSKGIIIPSSILKVLHICESDQLDLRVENNQIVLSKIMPYESMILEDVFTGYTGVYDPELIFTDDLGEEKW